MQKTQMKKEKINRVQVRLPESLMRHVEFRTGQHGMYVDSSDYIRDLIRRDAVRQQDPKEAFYELLAMGATAEESAFRQISLEDIKNLAQKHFEG